MAGAMRRFARVLGVTTAALSAVTLAACMTSGAFHHDAHLPVVKNDCAPCHGAGPQEPRAATKADCAVCHPQAREGSPETAGSYGQVGGRTAGSRPAGYQDVIFSHKSHAQANIACGICHPAKLLSGKPSLPSMSQCTSCHDGKVHSGECAVCHREQRRNIAPNTHDPDWEGRHGLVSKTTSGRCAACHEERACSDCHATKKPGSHVGGWDKSAHGFQALEERDRCATCHEAAYCTKCHSIPPPSHKDVNFKFVGHKTAIRFNAWSCKACHERSFCQACHP